MISLPNGRRCSPLNVFPGEWLEKDFRFDRSIDWYIFYRFYEPGAKGKLIVIKGMNHMDRLADRRSFTKTLLQQENDRLAAGWNPITKSLPCSNDLEIHPSTGFSHALKKAFDLLPDCTSKNEVRKALVHIQKAINDLRYESVPIGEVRQHHLELLLIKIGRNRKASYQSLKKPAQPSKNWRASRVAKQRKVAPVEWGATAFNHYRSYLQMLFKQLKKVGATEVKPVDDIEKRKSIKKKRTTLSKEQSEKVYAYLKENHYTFWRFIQLFKVSGARESEILKVRKEDVFLSDSRYWVMVKKGKGQWEEKPKTITRSVRYLWEQVFAEAGAGEYLFAKDLRPGPSSINPKQLTRRWKWHVKEKFGIDADLYSLKHEHTTQVVTMELEKIEVASRAAAKINGHNGTRMVKAHYDLEADERLHRALKEA